MRRQQASREPVVLLFAAAAALLGSIACAQESPAPKRATPPAAAAGAPAPTPPAAVPAPAASGNATPAGRPGIPPQGRGGPPPLEAYTYQQGGRRDPFLNLLNSGSVDPRVTTKRGDGAAGLSVNEITVRGVMLSDAKAIAQIQGPDAKSYIVRAGDKLLDGTVISIDARGLVIVQEVNDPLSTAKQREVRKLLRSLEDAK